MPSLPIPEATASLLAALCLSLTAQAQDEPAQAPVEVTPKSPSAKQSAWDCGARVRLSRIWQHLADRYDTDRDGTVTVDEYGRGDVRFRNFDRDGNGELTAGDFPDGAHVNGFNPMLLRMADRDRDQSVGKTEWQAFETFLDKNGDGEVVAAEFAALVGPRLAEQWNLLLLSFDQDRDGAFTAKDLAMVFRDSDTDGDGTLKGREMRPFQQTMQRPAGPLPKVGELAPDFTLHTAKGEKQTVQLASFRGERPVALIFGSYT